jgi:hypothetical protein
MKWEGHVAYMGTRKNEFKILVAKPEGKRSLRKPRHRLEDNIRIDLRELGLEDVNWIHLA